MYVIELETVTSLGRPRSFIPGKVFLGPLNGGQRDRDKSEPLKELSPGKDRRHLRLTGTQGPQQRTIHVHASHTLHSLPFQALLTP